MHTNMLGIGLEIAFMRWIVNFRIRPWRTLDRPWFHRYPDIIDMALGPFRLTVETYD